MLLQLKQCIYIIYMILSCSLMFHSSDVTTKHEKLCIKMNLSTFIFLTCSLKCLNWNFVYLQVEVVQQSSTGMIIHKSIPSQPCYYAQSSEYKSIPIRIMDLKGGRCHLTGHCKMILNWHLNSFCMIVKMSCHNWK